MFRELKQHLQLGKCQFKDFDVQIASVTISMILYILLSYFRRMNAYETIGRLFVLIKDDLCEKNIAQGLYTAYLYTRHPFLDERVPENILIILYI